MSAKDITALISQVNAAINPSAPVGGINATAHNAALLALIDAVGWWGTFHYSIVNSDGDNYDNLIEIGTQNYNDSTLSIKVSKNDGFSVDNTFLLDMMGQNGLIIVRDVDGDVATWRITSATTDNLGGIDYYLFDVESASTNSNKTLGALQSKKAGVTFIPAIGNRVYTELNIDQTDAGGNILTVDFTKGECFRFEFNSINTGGATTITPINLIDGQSGYISFEMETTIGNAQFSFPAPFVMAADTPIEALAKGIYYEYRIVKDKVIITSRFSLVTI